MLHDLVERLITENKFYGTEGRRGVENLCKIVRVLGYKDPFYFGQFKGGAIGDLIDFLEDNPGAITAIVDWISGQKSPEWEEKLLDELGPAVEDLDN